MGYPVHTGAEEHQVLRLLHRALLRHLLQYHHSPQDSLLYCKFNHTMCKHLVLVRARVLFAQRQRGEANTRHIDSRRPARVLLALNRAHTAYISSHTSTRQVSPVHAHTRQSEYPAHHLHTQLASSQAEHAQDAALDEASLH